MRFIKKLSILSLRLRRTIIKNIANGFGGFRRAEHIFMISAAIVIGILAAFGAILFHYILDLIESYTFQYSEVESIWLYDIVWWKCLLYPTLGGLIVGPIVHWIAKELRGSGVPEVMEAVAIQGGKIRPRIITAKIVAAAVTIGSGGSAGREGPIIHISSAIGSFLGQIMSVSAKRMRTFVACGAAGGIAATFNAPIAGALFAMEVIVGDFAVTQLSPIVIASVVATVLSRHYLGDQPAFDVPGYELISIYEFIPYSILGILAGLIAVLFIVSLDFSSHSFNKLKIPDWLKPAVGGLIVGIIGLFLPQVFGVGYHTISSALWSKDVQWLLLILIFAKILATSASLGSGGSGGVFAPSLFIGAVLGGLVGEIANYFQPELIGTSGAYALVGMGAVVSGTTHAPISAILIIFELTNDYRVIAPLMLCCILAVSISTFLKKESIYTMKLKRKGIDIFEGRDINILRKITVKDILNTEVETIKSDASFSEMIATLLHSSHHEFFVVNKDETLLGSFSYTELKQFLKDEVELSGLVIAADIAHPPPVYLYLDDNLDLAMHHFGRFNVDELPVLKNSKSKQLVGSVLRKDLINCYNREIFKRDLAGGMHSVVTAVNKERTIELAEGYIIKEVEAPDGFVGKTIRELNIRQRYGVEVILIRKHVSENSEIKDRPGALPLPDYKFVHNDSLLVMGTKKDVGLFG